MMNVSLLRSGTYQGLTLPGEAFRVQCAAIDDDFDMFLRNHIHALFESFPGGLANPSCCPAAIACAVLKRHQSLRP